MKEILNKRNYNSKTFDNGNGYFTHKAHVGHIHYFNKLGIGDGEKCFRQIDWTLNWDEKKRGWGFQFHSFHPFLPEYSDGWVEFRDLYQDKDQTIKFKAVCNKVKGRLVIPKEDDKISKSNYVIYDDAFGKGIDYILYFSRSALKKVVRIKDGYKKSDDMTFDFEIDFPNKDIKRAYSKEDIKYILDKTESKLFDTNKQTLIGNEKDDGNEWHTYLRGFVCWDNETLQTINVDYIVENGKTFLRKIIDKDFLNNSKGDVFTDTTTSYFAGAGDGRVKTYWLPWATAYNDTEGNDANASETEPMIGAQYWSAGGNFWISRAFFPINTGAIPSAATISAATFNYTAKISNQDEATGYAWYTLVETYQAANNALVGADFIDCGSDNGTAGRANQTPTVEGIDSGDRRLIGGHTASYAHYSFSLNATGLGWIKKNGETSKLGGDTGWTGIGMREGHDILSTPSPTISPNERITLYVYNSEQDGTDNDPYLEVTYTEGGGGVANNSPFFGCNF